MNAGLLAVLAVGIIGLYLSSQSASATTAQAGQTNSLLSTIAKNLQNALQQAAGGASKSSGGGSSPSAGGGSGGGTGSSGGGSGGSGGSQTGPGVVTGSDDTDMQESDEDEAIAAEGGDDGEDDTGEDDTGDDDFEDSDYYDDGGDDFEDF